LCSFTASINRNNLFTPKKAVIGLFKSDVHDVDDCLKDMSHSSDNPDLFLLFFICSSMQHANVSLE